MTTSNVLFPDGISIMEGLENKMITKLNHLEKVLFWVCIAVVMLSHPLLSLWKDGRDRTAFAALSEANIHLVQQVAEFKKTEEAKLESIDQDVKNELSQVKSNSNATKAKADEAIVKLNQKLLTGSEVQAAKNDLNRKEQKLQQTKQEIQAIKKGKSTGFRFPWQ